MTDLNILRVVKIPNQYKLEPSKCSQSNINLQILSMCIKAWKNIIEIKLLHILATQAVFQLIFLSLHNRATIFKSLMARVLGKTWMQI